MKGKLQYCRISVFHALLVTITLVNLFPLYFMISTSFKSQTTYVFHPYSVPMQVAFENFGQIMVKYNFVRAILNSSIITFFSVVVGITFSVLAAFAIARMEFPGRDILFSFFVALIAVPPIVVVTPLYVFMAKVGMINTYPSAITVYVGFILPFSIFLLTGFFQSIPVSLVDAAHLDGCTEFGVLWRIFVPLSKAPIITLGLVNGLWVWNELLIALVFLQRERMRTLMAAIAFSQSRFARNVPFMITESLIATIPPLIVYIVARRYLVRGFMTGITK